jgi:hypothetical protein
MEEKNGAQAVRGSRVLSKQPIVSGDSPEFGRQNKSGVLWMNVGYEPTEDFRRRDGTKGSMTRAFAGATKGVLRTSKTGDDSERTTAGWSTRRGRTAAEREPRDEELGGRDGAWTGAEEKVREALEREVPHSGQK